MGVSQRYAAMYDVRQTRVLWSEARRALPTFLLTSGLLCGRCTSSGGLAEDGPAVAIQRRSSQSNLQPPQAPSFFLLLLSTT